MKDTVMNNYNAEPHTLVGFFYIENNLAKNLMEKIIYLMFIKQKLKQKKT
jgi:hypothetical protein